MKKNETIDVVGVQIFKYGCQEVGQTSKKKPKNLIRSVDNFKLSFFKRKLNVNSWGKLRVACFFSLFILQKYLFE